jgi:hypothetical protein
VAREQVWAVRDRENARILPLSGNRPAESWVVQPVTWLLYRLRCLMLNNSFFKRHLVARVVAWLTRLWCTCRFTELSAL